MMCLSFFTFFFTFIAFDGILHKRIPPRTPNMNAHIESFHRILQDDCLSRYDFSTYGEAYETATESMIFYNERRMNSSIKDMTPLDFYKQKLIQPIPIQAIRL